MAPVFTGATGWTGLHPWQLGGPPRVQNWGRPLAAKALPLLAHAFSNDLGTFNGTFGLLNRPEIQTTLANGGQGALTLDIAGRASGMVWGRFVWGGAVYGGTGVAVAQGDVIRLTEVGGPDKRWIYSGIAESFPDVMSGGNTSHQIVLAPFGIEVTRAPVDMVYTVSTDIAQVVRDAVAHTQHCWCDQASVPPTTGIFIAGDSDGAVDFRGQKVDQVLDTCRSIAGPSWYWHVDDIGRVWFQYQASQAVYTLLPAHVESRTSNGGDIADRINRVPAVGGVPDGGSANIQVTVNGTSQAAIGVRTLDPPLQVAGITDLTTLTALANGIVQTLDQVWTRVAWQLLPPTGVANERHPGRIHAARPGGAVIRAWEATVNPLPESGVGAGYIGPYIGQTVTYDGLRQAVEAGSQPVTSSSDVENMVKRMVASSAANAFQNTAASLNLKQTVTGSFQSSPGGIDPATGNPTSLWRLTQAEFSVSDQNAKVRAEMGNLNANGISPAQWGFRANDAGGNPIFDSEGLIAVMKQIGFVFTVTPGNTSSTTPGVIPTITKTFTVARQSRVFYIIRAVGFSNVAYGNVDPYMDGVNQYAQALVWDNALPASTVTWALSTLVAAGTHTLDLRAYVSAAGTFNWLGANLDIYLLGAA